MSSFDSPRFRGFLAVAVMLLVVTALYRPWLAWDRTQTLFGFDYLQLHARRLDYAREALLNRHPHLPSWYSREALGTPFWSNIQNFPFLPTRYPLLTVDPLQAYALGVNLAAALAALFTYWYCRRIGLGLVAAAVSGWTFAASGFFAARVMAGHLPLLEAYPALPLLLWLIEIVVQRASPRRLNVPLLALGVASGCIVAAGHPQLPAYALIAAIGYTVYRVRHARALDVLLAIFLGIGLAGFVLWPMVELVLRSTRFHALETPWNDIVFPYDHLSGFALPWKNGFPDPFGPNPTLGSRSGAALFWETYCYVGWVPLAAAVVFLARRKSWEQPWPFFVVLGTLALALALPIATPLRSLVPETILRSSSRQLYLTAFALALLTGRAIDCLPGALVRLPRSWVLGITLAALTLHVLDLGSHDLRFIRTLPAAGFHPAQAYADLPGQLGDGRIAMDYQIMSTLNRQIDDVGFFDSVILARPYRALLDLSDLSPTSNLQSLNGAQMSARALAATATRQVVTFAERNDLPHISDDGPVHIYAVPSPAARASFLPLTQASFLDDTAIHERLRNPKTDLAHSIMLPREAAEPVPARTDHATVDSTVEYKRPSSDLIVANVHAARTGFLRVVEAFDPGWHARVDGVPTRVLPADGFLLAVRLEPGIHEVRLRYDTLGAATGIAISLTSLALLVVLVFRRPSPLQPLSNGHRTN